MASKKSSSGRTNAARSQRKAATNPRAKAREAKEPKLTREERQAQRAKEAQAREARVAQGARLGDFLADYGTDESGLPITNPEHSLRQAMRSDPEVLSDIMDRYQIHQLPFNVKEELGLTTDVEPKESLKGAPRGGLATGETKTPLSDVTGIEDDENIGADTGVLSSQLGTGGSRAALGRATTGDLTPPQPGVRRAPETGGPIASPERRRRVLPRPSQIREALSASPMGLPGRAEDQGMVVAPKDVAESRRLPDVPNEPRWTDLGLAPTSQAVTRNKVRQENVYRMIVGGAATRMHLEQQANPNQRIEIPKSFRAQNINPEFAETAAYLAENEGSPEEWSPETKAFFRKHGMSGISAGSIVGGTSLKGADAVTRKVNTTRLGQVRGNNPQLIMTGTSKRFPKGAVIDVNLDKLSNQFQISNIDLATGETIRRPELDVQAVEGTTPASGDARRSELELVNPLDTTPPDPYDPNYSPRYSLVDIPIRGPKDLPDSDAARQEAAAREYQAKALAGDPAAGKKGAQPFQTGIAARGSGKFTEPPFGMREHGSGAGVKPEPGPDIQRLAEEGGMSAEDALTSVRELGGRAAEIQELMDPIQESVYGAHDINRVPVRKPQQFVTQRRIQVPKANRAMKKNAETGVMERATQGYEVFAPTNTQIDDYLDAMAIEPGSKEEADIIQRMDTGVGSFAKSKMTKAQREEPLRDTEIGGKRSSKVIRATGTRIVKDTGMKPVITGGERSFIPVGTRGEAVRPLSGQFSAKKEAELRAGEQRREEESAARESWRATPDQKENWEWTRAHTQGDPFGELSPMSLGVRGFKSAESIGWTGVGAPHAVTRIAKNINEDRGEAAMVKRLSDSGVPVYKDPGSYGEVFAEDPGYAQVDPYGYTPKAALSTPSSAVSESPQLGDIWSAATGARLTGESGGARWSTRPAGSRSTVVPRSPKGVPDVMDREAFATYQENKRAAAAAPAPAKRSRKAPAAEAPAAAAPAAEAPSQPAKVIRSKRNNQ